MKRSYADLKAAFAQGSATFAEFEAGVDWLLKMGGPDALDWGPREVRRAIRRDMGVVDVRNLPESEIAKMRASGLLS